MKRIVPGIGSLEQHLYHLEHDPQVYRPSCCPHCGKAGLHRHGSYERNTPRGQGQALSLAPLLILRFYCPCCRSSCSRLPACLSPRRHYDWACQQAVLSLLLAGISMSEVARRWWPSRHTLSCWVRRWTDQFAEHALHLRHRFPELGRHDGWRSFWSACFDQMPLREAMTLLDRAGVIVP